MLDEAQIRKEIKEIGVRLVEANLVQGTWGNISVRLDDKYMLVTPSGLDYMRLTPEDMVKVEISTLNYEGNIKPTSEKKIHAAIYRERSDIGAVIHSHPFYSSSIAAARCELPVLTKDMSTVFLGHVRVGRYGLPGTKKLTKATLYALRGRNACFMANHGIVACAANLIGAFNACRLIEEMSKKFISIETMNLTKKDTFDQADVMTVFRNRKKYKLKN
ncbi:MAG: class II aldolase/adducin family protein [Christensenellaceae bacterium]|jgi:ribulose-5-phosphate 4-epimerase/fuculose-1-phosphate aldolase|nr:class II aldolase/adducin family protein [Christensenellaceae bacterium]